MDVEIKDEKTIAYVQQETGPPWHDDLTGELLDTEKVKIAMQKERDSLSEFHAYDQVPQEKVDDIWSDKDATVVKS
eukprot:12146765-Heterocapsa_arctica.AAC.1